MAFRLPRYCFLHAAKAAGLSAITVSENAAAGFPKVRLIDGQHAPLAKFDTDPTAVTFDVNRGAAGLEAVDRLIIPSGHNLAGATTIAVFSDDNSGFTSPATLLSAVAVSAGLIDKPLTGAAGDRQAQYLRMTVTGSGAWELGELWLTSTRTFGATDNVLDPGWVDRHVPSTVRAEFPSGVVSVLQLGEPKRVFEFEHRWLASTDLAIYDELAAAAGYGVSTFWLDPPDDGEAALAVEFSTAPERTQDHPVPKSAVSYTYRVNLVESLA